MLACCSEVLPCLTQRGYGQVVFNGGDDAEESKNKLKETVVSSSKGIGPTLVNLPIHFSHVKSLVCTAGVLLSSRRES